MATEDNKNVDADKENPDVEEKKVGTEDINLDDVISELTTLRETNESMQKEIKNLKDANTKLLLQSNSTSGPEKSWEEQLIELCNL